MTVKELKEKLSLLPDGKEVEMHAFCGDENDPFQPFIVEI